MTRATRRRPTTRISTYGTSPLWGVVDGPWKVSAFNADGQVTFVPNSSYSGPVKPTLKSFTELPYTTDTAEFNQLVGGNVDVGYVPTQDIQKGTTNPPEDRAKQSPAGVE